MYNVNRDLMAKLGLMPRALASRTALDTGGARGIGEGLAWTLAKLGAQVVIVDLLPGGQDVADQIKKAGAGLDSSSAISAMWTNYWRRFRKSLPRSVRSTSSSTTRCT